MSGEAIEPPTAVSDEISVTGTQGTFQRITTSFLKVMILSLVGSVYLLLVRFVDFANNFILVIPEFIISYMLYIIPTFAIILIVGRIITSIRNRFSTKIGEGNFNKSSVWINENSFRLDFIFTSGLTLSLFILLPYAMDWASSMIAWSSVLNIISTTIIGFLATAIVVLFYTGLSYRFLSRVVRLFNIADNLTEDLSAHSARIFLVAFGLAMVILTGAIQSIGSGMLFMVLPGVGLYYLLHERFSNKIELKKFGIRMKEYIDTTNDKTEQVSILYRHSIKRFCVWCFSVISLITILILINTRDFITGVILLFATDPYFYWGLNLSHISVTPVLISIGMFSCVGIGLITLFYTLRFAINRRDDISSIMGMKSKLEWIVDFFLTLVSLILIVILLLPEIFYSSSPFITSILYNEHTGTSVGYFHWAPLVLAMSWLACIIIAAIATLLRLVSNILGFTGSRRKAAIRGSIWSSRLLILSITLALAFQLMITGGFYFGIVTGNLVLLTLVVIIIQMVISQKRQIELTTRDEGGIVE